MISTNMSETKREHIVSSGRLTCQQNGNVISMMPFRIESGNTIDLLHWQRALPSAGGGSGDASGSKQPALAGIGRVSQVGRIVWEVVTLISVCVL